MHIVCWHIGVDYLKVCPFCKAELPEEAIYCLNCATVLNERQSFPAVKVKKDKSLIAVPRKKILGIVAIILSVAIVFSSCIFAIKSTRNNEPNKDKPETTLAPVTEENGESVTDENGEQVFEVIEITDTTTEKQGLLDKLFGVETTTSPTTEPEATTNPTTTESTTNKTEDPVTTTTSTTESTTLGNTYSSDEDFQYEPYSNSTTKISITKYTGNASYVTVPVYIDGLMVVEIQSDAFKDNDNIKTIDIPDSDRAYIWLRNNCFNNLSSFENLNLYANDIGMYGKFALYCPIKNIHVTSWQYKFVDGALYQWNSSVWEFIYFAGNPCYSVLNLADWCTGIEGSHNLKYADNLKVINVSKETSFVPTSYSSYNQNLEAINVEAGSSKFYSKDGVLFYKGSTDTDFKGSIYPYGKKDKVFVMPSGDVGYTLSVGTTSNGATNIYVEEIHIPANCNLERADYLSTYSTLFPNLKKIHISEGHSQYTTIRKTFTGEMQTF